MKNIFENACFGKAYKTRDGRKALLWYYHVGGGIIDQVVLITTGANQILVDGNGKDLNEPYHNTPHDIVSEWQEPDHRKRFIEKAWKWMHSNIIVGGEVEHYKSFIKAMEEEEW